MKKTNERMKVIKHILLDALAKVINGLISEYKILQVTAESDGEHRVLPKETWVYGSEIEIPWIT